MPTSLPTLNLGIVAHVDAGKTSLTERLLYAAGVIDELGSVDHGSTQTDTLALERQRGITIRSAVTSFRLPGGRRVGAEIAVNVIDTPGHHDFVAEVERVLGVLDGAVLVVSVVEGVQAHTRVLLRTLRRLGIPTVIFANKIDRVGARSDALVDEIAGKLGVTVVPLGRVARLGTREARSIAWDLDDPDDVVRLVEPLSLADDRLATDYLDDETTLRAGRLRSALSRQSRAGLVHPLIFGSAITGAGVDQLMSALPDLLPVAGKPASDSPSHPPGTGTVFKIERDPSGQRVAYVRMTSGSIRVREPVATSSGHRSKITGISLFDRGGREAVESLADGQIGTVTGLADVRIGDRLGATAGPADSGAAGASFDPPTLESIIVARDGSRRGALFGALTELAEQDPLIGFRQEDDDLLVSLYGEVQQQVLEATLDADYGLSVDVRAARTLCVERITGIGEAVERMGDAANPFLATVGLRIEPAPVGQGISFDLEVELGAMPYAFFAATEAAVRAELAQGPAGWPVPDARVVMTQSRYAPRQSHAHARFDKSMSSTGADFRGVTPLVLAAAMRRAGTVVCEPVHRFGAEFPADCLGLVLPMLTRHHAIPLAPLVDPRRDWAQVDGLIPADQVRAVQQQLPGLSHGQGVLETRFAEYTPVTGAPPSRPRRRPDAYRRKDYLLQLLRRVDAGQPA